VRRVRALLIAALALAAAGCTAEAPMVVTPPDTMTDGGRMFADAVIAITRGDQVMSCVDGLPTCGSGPQTGSCAMNPAVGPNDGVYYDLGAQGRIELALLCGAIVEHGGGATESADFKIWSKVAASANAVVEVSRDGSIYVQLDYLNSDNKTFSLQRSGFSEVRFVRISDIAGGGVQIDAVEAL
jgi:hypothetical protein